MFAIMSGHHGEVVEQQFGSTLITSNHVVCVRNMCTKLGSLQHKHADL